MATADELGGSEVVDDAIDEADSEVLNDYGDPSKKSTFWIDNNQTKYEFRVDLKKVFRIDRVFIRDDDNNRVEYTSDSTASESTKKYVKDLEFNTITFASDTISARAGNRVEVHFVPNEIHLMAVSKAALYILDRADTVNSGETSSNLGLRLLQRVTRLENSIMLDQATGSTNNIHFDPTFGDVIPQRRFRTFS